MRAKAPNAFDELATVLAIWVLAILGGLAWVLFSIWSALPDNGTETTLAVHWIGTNRSWTATENGAATALVLSAGGLGGAVHIARSFAARTGAATFRSRWAWWYVLTPAIGAIAGFVVTLGVPGGVLDSGGADDESWNGQAPLAVFVAFVSGLFARAALERPERFLPRPDRQVGQIRVTRVDPSTVPAATTAQTFTITGTGFTADTIVRIADLPAKSVTLTNGALTATFDSLPVSDDELFVAVENETTTRDIAVVERDAT